jgi:hypothetical protein
MNRAPWTCVAHAFRRTALPLASYYAVTLAIPLANGAARSGAFAKHALVVLVAPLVAVILACAVHALFKHVSRRSASARVYATHHAARMIAGQRDC